MRESKPGKVYTVYKHITPDGRSYVGMTGSIPEKRWGSGRCYCGNPEFTEAVHLYGWENIRHEILLETKSHEEAAQKERDEIAKLREKDPALAYNILPGDQSTKVACIDTLTIYPSLHEAAEKAKIKRDCIKWSCNTGHPDMKGRYWCYVDRLDSFLPANNRRTYPRPVINLDTGKVYPTALDAARECKGSTATAIGAVCLGKPYRKTAGGYRWAFAEVQTREWKGAIETLKSMATKGIVNG